MLPKNQGASVLFTKIDVKYLCSIVCMVVILSKRRLFRPEARCLRLAALTEEKTKQVIWRTYYTGKTAELFHRGCVVLYRSADDFKIRTEVLNVLEWTPSFFVKPLQTMLDLMMRTFLGKVVLTGKKYRKLWSSTVNLGVISPDKDSSDAGTASFSPTKDFFVGVRKQRQRTGV